MGLIVRYEIALDIIRRQVITPLVHCPVPLKDDTIDIGNKRANVVVNVEDVIKGFVDEAFEAGRDYQRSLREDDESTIEVLEQLAREEEFWLTDRWRIGYARGLKRAVLVVRYGESLDKEIRDAKTIAMIRNGQDPFDLGMIDGLIKARDLITRRN